MVSLLLVFPELRIIKLHYVFLKQNLFPKHNLSHSLPSEGLKNVTPVEPRNGHRRYLVMFVD